MMRVKELSLIVLMAVLLSVVAVLNWRDENQIRRLSAEVMQAKIELRQASSMLGANAPASENFELSAGNSMALFAGRLYVGMDAVYPSFVSLTVDNRYENLRVGESVKYRFAGEECRLTVTKLATKEGRAAFVNSCVLSSEDTRVGGSASAVASRSSYKPDEQKK